MIKDELTQMLKVFIDTNIWFSMFYGSANASQVINLHISNKIKGVISQQVLFEIIKNFKLKIPEKLKDVENLMKSTPPQIIKTPLKINKNIEKCVDKKDQKIFQSAIDSNCDYFVTGNLKDFNVKKLEKIYKIKIVSPKEFLSKI